MNDILVVRYLDKEVFYSLVDKKVIGFNEYENPENFDLNQFKKIKNLFIQTGGGLVLKNDSVIQRIDKSYDHKLQLNSIIFSHNDTIFRFGGYGFFDNRSFITYYDEVINEWETYNYGGNFHPKGTHDSSYFKNGNLLYIIGGFYVNPSNRSQSLKNHYLQLFSFETKQWELLGETKRNYSQQFPSIEIENGIIFLGRETTDIINFEKNEITIIEDNPLHRKIKSSRINPLVYQDTIFFLNSDDLNEMSYVSLNNFISNYPSSKEKLLVQKVDPVLIQNFILGFLLISFIFGLIFSGHQVLKSKLLVTKRGNVYYFFSEVFFTEFESSYLKILFERRNLENPRIENSEVLGLIQEDLDIGTLTRRKNELINVLDEKLKFIMRSSDSIIIVRKSTSDRRNTYYSIKSGVFYFI